MNDPKLVSASIWVYRGLMYAFPRGFRQEYGDAMVQLFRDMCLRGGKTSLAAVWGQTLLDYAVTLVSEHVNRGVEMTRSKWIQLSGWGMASSGFLFLLGMMAANRPTYSQYNAASWPIDPFFNSYGTVILAISLLLLAAGMAGLLARFGNQAGVLGKIGLVVGTVSGLASAVGAVGLGIVDSEPWWSLFFVGFMTVNLGLTLFGISCLRRRLFSRWNGLPLAIGTLLLLFIVASMGFIPWQASNSLINAVIIFFALGMALVGFRLLSEAEGKWPALA